MSAAAGGGQAAAGAESAVSAGGKGIMACCKGIYRCLAVVFSVFARCVKKLPAPVISMILRVLNLGNAILLALASVYLFMFVPTANLGVTRSFLGIYTMVFALLICLFETRIQGTSRLIRRLFGFMFTPFGRTIFIIFCGAVCFGLLSDNEKDSTQYTVALWVGIATAINAAFNCFVVCSHEGFRKANANPDWAENEGQPADNDPSKMTEAQIQAYLNAHPEIAQQAASSITVTVQQPGDGPAPAAAAAPGSNPWGSPGAAGGSAGGGIGGFFGFGRRGGAAAAEAPAPAGPGAAVFTGSATGGYVPPSVPEGAPNKPSSTTSAAAASGGGFGNDEVNPFSGIGAPPSAPALTPSAAAGGGASSGISPSGGGGRPTLASPPNPFTGTSAATSPGNMGATTAKVPTPSGRSPAAAAAAIAPPPPPAYQPPTHTADHDPDEDNPFAS